MRMNATVNHGLRNWRGWLWVCLGTLVFFANPTSDVSAQEQERESVIPHNQDGVPNQAYSPRQAVAAMTVPDGFQVEIVASEPDLVNPIAMTFDERGRLWVTESFEYPRREAGPGRDRIKILEDTTGDGRFDSVKIFAEGLNIPSGIAVGHGGVWVANSPDLLLLRDTDGDDRADTREVIVTGFGRDDTHELPNSLTWGPDGYLYGLNGVFNYSTIQQDGQTFQFTCAMFRVDPVTRQFEVFAEGTSNPWGIAFDDEGEAFVSACVIDHLWHITESGYYLRQAGAYPPHTWIIDSIVDHKHFKAAYCGIHYFDSPAYPAAYRKRLYMGNIHGGSINVDQLDRFGSTYKATGQDDLLRANDVWFMPVAQKTGPDGCLYVLDWYDRYHCYQDANRDPGGIDRAKGRLYRIRYQDTPRVFGFDLAKRTDAELIRLLGDPNVYFRDTAQRLLAERLVSGRISFDGQASLLSQALNERVENEARRHAVWALISGRRLDVEPWLQMCQHPDPVVQAFAIRAAGNFATLRRDQKLQERWQAIVREHLPRLVGRDLPPTAQVNLLIAIRKVLGGEGGESLLRATANHTGDDGLLPRILWQNLLAVLDSDPALAEQWVLLPTFLEHPLIVDLAPRLAEVLLSRRQWSAVWQLAGNLRLGPDGTVARQRILQAFEKRLLNGEISPAQLREVFQTAQVSWSSLEGLPEYARLMAAAGSGVDLPRLVASFADPQLPQEQRLAAFSTIALLARDPQNSPALSACLELARGQLVAGAPPEVINHIVDQLVRLSAPEVADLLVGGASQVEPAARSRIVEALTSRPAAAKVLFRSMGGPQDVLNRSLVNETQIQRLLLMGDPELVQLIETKWGSMQTGNRGLMVDEMLRVRRIVHELPGDFNRGWLVYDRVCGQCHQFGGRGEKVGPAIDSNGRASLSQLLSNMIDPNLVIGTDYQARLVATLDGRVYSGLVAEDTPERLVLKLQGGKTITIARSEIEQERVSPQSLMPEGQTRQMPDQEIADLMSVLLLNNPQDRTSGQIPEAMVREQTQWSPDRYQDLLSEVFANFTTQQWFEGGLALLGEHQSRPAVIRTHPQSPTEPTVLQRQVELPAEAMLLRLGVHHHPSGSWRLKVTVNDQELHSQVINAEACRSGWLDLELDLSAFSTQTITLRLENHSHEQKFAFAYWSHAYLYPVAAPLPDMKVDLQADMQPQYVDRRKQPPVMPVPEGWVKLAADYPVFVDMQAKHVIVDGQIIQNNALLEMFACPVDSGKEHESVVSVFSSSQLIHAALLAVGAKPGHPVRFDPRFEPATGTRVGIEVQWRDGEGKIQTADAKSWVRNLQTKAELDVDWVFGGSVMYKDPDTGREYYLAEGGELVCVSNFSTATLDLPTPSPAEAVNQMYEANTDKIPPLGTPVRLIFKPAPPAEK
jgi:putative membrane-bound dehydrogenase-like protein